MNSHTLSAAAERAGLSPHQVRIYLDMGLLRPCATTAGGYRLFDERCVERLKLIKACRDAQINLAEIAEFLRGLDGSDHARCQAAERLLRARIRDKRQALARCERVLAASMSGG